MKTIVSAGDLVRIPKLKCDYLTPNKKYQVKRIVQKEYFVIICDKGYEIYCSHFDCGHLNGKNWILT